MNVDGALLLSHLLCENSILSCLNRTWPSDVGISLEESGLLLRVLSVFAHSHLGKLEIYLFHTNIRYVFRFAQHHHACRLGRFLGPEIHRHKTLHDLFLGRLVSYDHLLCGGR